MSNHTKLAAALLCSAGIALTATAGVGDARKPCAQERRAGRGRDRALGRRWRGGGWGWGLGGFAAGAIIGSAIASPYYYGGYYPYGTTAPIRPTTIRRRRLIMAARPMAAPAGGGDAGYCAQRYRSYDPATGTFLGYDGQRHPCP